LMARVNISPRQSGATRWAARALYPRRPSHLLCTRASGPPAGRASFPQNPQPLGPPPHPHQRRLRREIRRHRQHDVVHPPTVRWGPGPR
jgi:hypothetical protein